jgi:HSP20 family molecular chaperone IbpA
VALERSLRTANASIMKKVIIILKTMKEATKILKGLGIRETYYHLDEEGNLFYAFLAPGRRQKDFKISYRGDYITVETDDTKLTVKASYYSYKFDLKKAEATYKDGTLIVKVPPKSDIFGKILVE